MTTEKTETTDNIIAELRAGRAAAPRGINELFAGDPERFAGFSCRVDDLLLDFSKTSIGRDELEQLLNLAQVAGVEERREAMFAGERINQSEDRAVLHTALRAGLDDDGGGGGGSGNANGSNSDSGGNGGGVGDDILAVVRRERRNMLDFAEGCRAGEIVAADGKPYTDVVNIGIGGSDLGPAMATAALAPFGDGGDGDGSAGPLRAHFVSNMDGAHLGDTLAKLDARRALIIVSSKTFTTIETMTNAERARAWLAAALGEDGARAQMAAVSAAPDLAGEFGIARERVFGYQQWVGGRYSLWGAVGLPIALAVGAKHFSDFLRGAAAMDAHFRAAPARRNLPVLLALVSVWHRNVCGYPARVILPYDERLHLLPAFTQQLDMESNGKSARRGGDDVTLATSPIVWGSAGTNAQHAYFQMLHQGTDIVPGEFIAALRPTAADAEQHRLLLANCLAQTAALMRGDASAGANERHRHFAGERPSVTILHRQLTPYALGRLIALYEHRAFVEGVIWDVNSYDQWGVELGKSMARRVRPMLDRDAATDGQDDSTRGLLAHYHKYGDAQGNA